MNTQTPAMSDATWRHLAARADAQDWPPATLYVVATPIGNLLDLGLRAWQALARCNVVAAEDTRASRALLDAWGIRTPMIATHRHNEARAAQAIVQRLQQGERVALVSDAGAPAVSDPGALIVREVTAAGFRVVPIPGPSAVIAALMASGATSNTEPGFAFAGFAPAKPGARRQWLRQHAALPFPVVFFETPHRLAASLDDIRDVCGAARGLTIARELTKRFEQVATLPAGDAPDWLAGDSHRGQGEFVLILHAAETVAAAPGHSPQTVALMDALLEAVSVKDAARIFARANVLPRDAAYKLALDCSAARDGGNSV